MEDYIDLKLDFRWLIDGFDSFGRESPTEYGTRCLKHSWRNSVGLRLRNLILKARMTQWLQKSGFLCISLIEAENFRHYTVSSQQRQRAIECIDHSHDQDFNSSIPQSWNIRSFNIISGCRKANTPTSSSDRWIQSDFADVFVIIFPIHDDSLFKSRDPLVVHWDKRQKSNIDVDEVVCPFHLAKKTMMTASFNATENFMIDVTIQKLKMNADYFTEKIIQSLAST
jgi:hypothetical protein